MTSEFLDHLETISGNHPHYANARAAAALKSFTSARIGVGRRGPRPLSCENVKFRADHAAARDTIYDFVAEDLIDRHQCVKTQTLVRDKEEYLLRPDLGRRLQEPYVASLRSEFKEEEEVLLVVGDGLSANAIEANLDDILPSLRVSLAMHGLRPSRPIFVKFARVAVMDHIGEILRAKTVIVLIGERPGLITSESMSAYLCYRPRIGTIESDRNVISNIHRGGIPPLEAGAVIADLIHTFMEYEASGVALKNISKARPEK